MCRYSCQPLLPNITIDKNWSFISPIPYPISVKANELYGPTMTPQVRQVSRLFTGRRAGYRAQSLLQQQSASHWWKAPPTVRVWRPFGTKSVSPHIQPLSTYKQLDFSSLLHLNFKNLETVNMELSALELILFLAPTHFLLIGSR